VVGQGSKLSLYNSPAILDFLPRLLGCCEQQHIFFERWSTFRQLSFAGNHQHFAWLQGMWAVTLEVGATEIARVLLHT
jgi:hypothetical protein